MKTKEEVLIKLGEQTKKVNVEFTLIDDLRKDLNEPFKDISDLILIYDVELQNLKDKFIKKFNSMSSNISKAKNSYKSVLEKTKDLGVQMPSDLTTLISEMDKDFKEQNAKLSKVKSL